MTDMTGEENDKKGAPVVVPGQLTAAAPLVLDHILEEMKDGSLS